MRPTVRLDSVVFKLTPTRTRYDMVIAAANEKTEKIASGLLEPFLAHLKTARDQIARGGYSIRLEVRRRVNAPWFTKDTIERFVRFVSTPEVLERVGTVESEISQIEEALCVQGNERLGLSTVENQHKKTHEDLIEVTFHACIGRKHTLDPGAEKAIVLYKHGSHPNLPDSNGGSTQKNNSKAQLLRALESRKAILQKEQGMAFARAAAAGFDMDHMDCLMSFAECFGAARLLNACLRYMELWREKYETGQWLEVEAAEAMPTKSEFGSLNEVGVRLSGDFPKQKEFGKAWDASDLGIENNIKTDKSLSSDSEMPLGQHDFQGQFQNPAFPQWPLQSPPGQPMLQPYAMQDMPYYESYQGNTPFFNPLYPPKENSRFANSQRTGLKQDSMDSRDKNIEDESPEMGFPSTRPQDGAEKILLEFEKETFQGHELHKKHGHSGKKQPGMVVIHNINYITPKGRDKSGSGSENEDDNQDWNSIAQEVKHKKTSGSSRKKERRQTSAEKSNIHGTAEVVYGQVSDSGNWQAFQSFLLRANEKTSPVSVEIFAGEKQSSGKRRQNGNTYEHILLPERDSDGVQRARVTELYSADGSSTRKKLLASDDECLISSEGRRLRDSQLDARYNEIESGMNRYRRPASDDFTVYGQERQMGSRSSLDPLTENDYEHAGLPDQCFSHIVPDDSFVIPLRTGTEIQLGKDTRTAIDMDIKFPSTLQKAERPSSRTKAQLSYEPNDLTLMPEHGVESASIHYNPAIDYDVQIPVENSAKLDKGEKDFQKSTKDGSKKSNNGKLLKVPQNGLEKRKMDVALRKGASSKLNTVAEAHKRADKLRAFKADLQKAKKEQEEEEIRRLEALKRERQKRIAARNNSVAAKSPLIPKQKRASLPARLSPSTYKGSKFSDSEPGSFSPFPKSPIRTTSLGSIGAQKIGRTSSSNANGLSRSIPSLPGLKKESKSLNSDSNTSSLRTKKLPDPKGSSIHRATSLKPANSHQVTQRNIPDEPQMKKISAIMQLDKTKFATLPELKIKTMRTPAAVHKSGSKGALQKKDGTKASLSTDRIQAKKSNVNLPDYSNIGNKAVTDPVIEKTVVMLGNEATPAPVVQASQEILHSNIRYVEDGGNVNSSLDYQAIRAPPSPIMIGEVRYSNECKNDQLHSSEVLTHHLKDEPQKSNSIVTVKHQQAPYVRATSMEDPAEAIVECSEPAPILNSAVTTLETETGFRQGMPTILDTSLQTPKMYEKACNKESKGFKKLLKFGRKSHTSSSGQVNQDSDGSPIDGSTISVASGHVPTLKNLMSQDDSPVQGTPPPKVSRPFSLISPFRNKKIEKKQLVD